MSIFRDRYFHALGIRPGKNDKLDAACKSAHDIRQFEIELYWKRATYFWAFQAIAFTALGLLFKDGSIRPLGQLSLGRLLIPAPIGVLTALAGWLTARGSKFWQENWEAHVDLLENETKVRLTHVVLCRDSPQFSVSRINQRLLGYLALGWSGVLIVGAIPAAAGILKGLSLWLGLVVAAITFALAYGLFWTKTKLTGCVYRPDESDEKWADYPPKQARRKPTVPFIIWRDRSANDANTEQ
jgi:hypothetical protein